MIRLPNSWRLRFLFLSYSWLVRRICSILVFIGLCGYSIAERGSSHSQSTSSSPNSANTGGGSFFSGPSQFLIKAKELRPKVRYDENGRSVTEKPRVMLRLPLNQSSNSFGVCGTRHYSAGADGNDAWADPLTGCALVALFQKWKKESCPDGRAGCVISWGDISNNDSQYFNTHKSHTHGQCIDIRPMQKDNYLDRPVTYQDKFYDRTSTMKFVKLAISMGAQPIFFNDQALQKGVNEKDPKTKKIIESVRSLEGHSNHLHICFLNNKKTQESCKNYQPNYSLCPELLNPIPNDKEVVK